MGGACRGNGKKRNVYRLLVRKPEGKRPRPRQRWWIILGLFLDRWYGVKWTGLVWLSTCEFGNELSGSINWETIEWPHNWWPLE
jgi:hypothetical protein